MENPQDSQLQGASSNDNQKNIVLVKVVLLEAAFVALLLGAFLFALNYFHVLSLGKFFPALPNFQRAPITPTPTISQNLKDYKKEDTFKYSHGIASSYVQNELQDLVQPSFLIDGELFLKEKFLLDSTKTKIIQGNIWATNWNIKDAKFITFFYFNMHSNIPDRETIFADKPYQNHQTATGLPSTALILSELNSVFILPKNPDQPLHCTIPAQSKTDYYCQESFTRENKKRVVGAYTQPGVDTKTSIHLFSCTLFDKNSTEKCMDINQ